MGDPTLDGILPITATAELPAAAGGKAHGLAAMARHGLAVPAAWAVLPTAPAQAVEALARALRGRGVRRVAVRSSAADEDGAGASFAGMHSTELGVPLERLTSAVAEVAASPTSPRARAYREQLDLPPAAGPCGVVVQEMVEAEWAGVAFGRGDAVWIEAVRGLGELAVSGEASPELLVARRRESAWVVDARRPRRQAEALVLDDGGLRRVPAPRGAEGGDVLPAEAAAAIAGATHSLEAALGRPLDIEWAWRGGAAAFLQARPQTRPLSVALPAGEQWTRGNVRDVFPEIPSAFARTTAVRAADAGQRESLRRQGFRIPPDVPLATCVFGRVAFNERVFSGPDALGMPRPWMHALLGGPGGTSNELAPMSLWRALRHPRVLLGVAGMSGGAERRAARHLARLRASRPDRPAAVGDMADLDLFDRVRTAMTSGRAAGVRHALELFSAASGWLYQAMAALRGVESPGAAIATLLEAEDVSVSTRQLEDLLSLALAFRAWAGGAAFLSALGPEGALEDPWRGRLPPSLWDAVRRWLSEYGHRGPFEYDLASPRYADDLRLLARALAPLVGAPEPPPDENQRRERRRRAQAETWARLAGALGWARRRRLASILRSLSSATATRERVRSEMAAEFAHERRDALELGRRLVARGQLDAPEQVFDLELEQLGRAVAEPAWDARTAVRRERARVAAWRRIEVPNRFRSEDVADFSQAAAAARDGVAELPGTAISPGEAVGPACILRSPADEARLALGGVLVAPATDPGWTPLFARAVAVVVEVGGLLSHSATVAREYGLPCVSNVEGATTSLRDGDVVKVDGTRGVVEIVSRAAAPEPPAAGPEARRPSTASVSSSSSGSSPTTRSHSCSASSRRGE